MYESTPKRNIFGVMEFSEWAHVLFFLCAFALETHWDDGYIKYSTMPLSNLQNIVNTNGVAKAQFYLGYSEDEEQPHLTLVGVDETGASMIGSNAYIYNFATPCPNTCNN